MKTYKLMVFKSSYCGFLAKAIFINDKKISLKRVKI